MIIFLTVHNICQYSSKISLFRIAFKKIFFQDSIFNEKFSETLIGFSIWKYAGFTLTFKWQFSLIGRSCFFPFALDNTAPLVLNIYVGSWEVCHHFNCHSIVHGLPFFLSGNFNFFLLSLMFYNFTSIVFLDLFPLIWPALGICF